MLNFDRKFPFPDDNGVAHDVDMGTYEGYNILFHKDITTFISVGVLLEFSKTEPVIMVGPDFMEAPEIVQRFFLYHEIGHIVHGHLTLTEADYSKSKNEIRADINKYYLERASRMDVDPNELVADQYAADILGEDLAVKCLIFMAEVIEECEEDIRNNPKLSDKDRELFLILNRASAKELRNRAAVLEQSAKLTW